MTSSRFFAALAVVIFHYDKKSLLFPTGLADFGYEAVTFFFILSGFVLTYTHGREGGLNVTAAVFAMSRLARIVPAYMLALIVALPFFVAGSLKAGFLDAGALLVPLMLQSWWPPASLLWNSPAWSLSNEILFYGLYPVLWAAFRCASPSASLITAGTMVLLVSALRYAIPHDTETWYNFSAYFPLWNLPQFILGIALAKLFVIRGPARQSRGLLHLTVAATALIIALKIKRPWLVDGSVLCLVFGTMVYALAGLKSHSLLSARPLVILGDASYAIYILHVPIWLWWDRLVRLSLSVHWPAALDFAAYLAAVLMLSIATLTIIEKPARSWLRSAIETP